MENTYRPRRRKSERGVSLGKTFTGGMVYVPSVGTLTVSPKHVPSKIGSACKPIYALPFLLTYCRPTYLMSKKGVLNAGTTQLEPVPRTHSVPSRIGNDSNTKHKKPLNSRATYVVLFTRGIDENKDH